jgi:hypothetical protein
MAKIDQGQCEHCSQVYNYMLLHSGFGDKAYAYCETCGKLATLDGWNPRMKNIPVDVGWHHEINTDVERYLLPCSCGGRFRKGASPRCPHCTVPLSAERAAGHIEQNAPGTAKGWLWQRNWSGLYCVAIEDPKNPGTFRTVKDPLIPNI